MSREYIKKNKNSWVKFNYFSGSDLPADIPISTPLSFVFAGENIILTKKKNGWWDIIGGKIEEGESWEDALKREAQEEIGVKIDFIQIVGYVLAENFGDSKETIFEGKTILPVTMSFAQEIDSDWKPLETKGREIFNKKEVIKLFQERDDNNQLMEIAEDVFDFFKKQKFDYSFKYFSSDDEVDFSKIIFTQAMTFVKEKDKFYLVKDFGEDFYSLPGGGCYLLESGEDCARREIVEEVQFEVDDLELLGTILVEVKKDNLVLSKTQQLRFLAKPKNVKEFELDPKMEIEERVLADFNSLKDKVMLLQNPTGEEILEDLKKRIWK